MALRGATGTARVRAAPLRRNAFSATFTVLPVAIPSSTMTAVRPSVGAAALPPEIALAPPLDFGELPFLFGLQIIRRGAEDEYRFLVHDQLRVLAVDHCAYCELRMSRSADLADKENVQGRLERFSDFETHRNAAAGQRQHHRIAPLALRQLVGELASRFTAVKKTSLCFGHRSTPFSGRTKMLQKPARRVTHYLVQRARLLEQVSRALYNH